MANNTQNFDFPSNSPVVDDTGMATVPWQQVFSRWHRLATTLGQSGTSANRPTNLLWVGRVYFDTTLGKPVWVKTVSSPAVWVDASGAVV